MEPLPVTSKTVCVVGLGYVGLPLAEAFSHHVKTIGFDIDTNKIDNIRKTPTKIHVTSDPTRIHDADFVMICVPTLLTNNNEPDLSYVKSAAATVGKQLKKGAVVILESTVYPGVTEDVLQPILEKESGSTCGIGFKIGYSPERINPGDDVHVLSKTTKIIAGMDKETTEDMAALYSLITTVYPAKDIRTAEAAKVVENIQRDVNIALINELSYIFSKIGINTKDVLEAAETKWNFHHYTPGIVGGHCIPTVPYFLAYTAKKNGYNPQIILTGRSTNDHMIPFISGMILDDLTVRKKKPSVAEVTILGLTYKENVADTRDNPVSVLIKTLKGHAITVYGYDPLLTPDEISDLGVIPLSELEKHVDCLVLAVPHKQFLDGLNGELRHLASPDTLFIDIKGVFYKDSEFRNLFNYRTL
ncbi:MAG: nucleotide sugar dehydrogenase [Methanomicrobiales archaeon HGW-Methanomicrobiales-3]|jgi:UDPglucose 6-dehydrogenase/UDP-N-acetyl-D-galactosamine dehydrogenase|nr:MAG: nucleotide sugar dehydrogenase [Methanomicrobiales archaeon HGW-Methanomicrobiales-3]